MYMSPAILNLILWVPFLLTVLVSGIFFCISGYKKGVWRALISFGATLLAALLSALLANALSGLITPGITGTIPTDSLGDDPIAARLSMLIVETVVRSLLSLVLFWLFMLILTVVLRIISGSIKKDKLIATEKPMRWLGLGVGLLSAVTFALLWLCPLYGSLSAFTPILDQAAFVGEAPYNSQEDPNPYLKSVQEHPVVALSGSAPMEFVYDGISSCAVGSVSIPVTDIAAVMEEGATLLNQISLSEDPATLAAQGRLLIRMMREEVVNQKWFHAMSMVMVEEVSAAVSEMTGPEADYLRQVIAVFRLPQDEFAGNCNELLAFCDYAIDHDILTILQSEDWDQLYSSGILQQAGALANCTDQAVELKRLMVVAAVAAGLCDDDLTEAQMLLEDYPITRISDPQLQLREAEAVMQAMFVTTTCPAEFVLRHPALGEPAMENFLKETDVIGLSGMYTSEQEELRMLLMQYPEYADALQSQLQHCAEAPIGSASFRTSCRLLLHIHNFARTAQFNYYDEYDADSLRFALDTVDANTFILVPAGKKMYVIMNLYPELLEADPSLGESSLSSGIVGLNGLSAAATVHTILSDPKGKNAIDLENCVGMYATNPLAVAALKQYLGSHGTDPLQLGSHLSAVEKDALRALIDQCGQRLTVDPDMAGTLSSSSSVPIQDVENMTIVVSGEDVFTDPQQVTEHNQSIAEALTYLKQFFDL